MRILRPKLYYFLPSSNTTGRKITLLAIPPSQRRLFAGKPRGTGDEALGQRLALEDADYEVIESMQDL
jgi:hypothetical protein